jgi:hypothetical protein
LTLSMARERLRSLNMVLYCKIIPGDAVEGGAGPSCCLTSLSCTEQQHDSSAHQQRSKCREEAWLGYSACLYALVYGLEALSCSVVTQQAVCRPAHPAQLTAHHCGRNTSHH